MSVDEILRLKQLTWLTPLLFKEHKFSKLWKPREKNMSMDKDI
jgi:hypothetical protein